MRVEMELYGFQEWADLPAVSSVPRVGETVLWKDDVYVVDRVRHGWAEANDGSTDQVVTLYTHLESRRS